MKLMAPENFDSDAVTERLNLTWKAQVDLSRLAGLIDMGANHKHYSF